MDSPNPKRPCNVPSITSPSQNPSSLPIAPSCNQSDVDSTISSFLSLSDSPLFSSPLSIGCSFDRVLHKVITLATENSGDEFDQDGFLDRTLQLASLLHKFTKRCIRKRATLQNSISWPLPSELTIKVFSMLDTKSLMQASVCCTMFNKSSKDRVCYSHIDLTKAVKPVDNEVVCLMLHRAGKGLESLKLGCISREAGLTALLTRSCLSPLTSNHGFARGLLKSLHLYNLVLMDCKSLRAVLSACSNLTDLKIVGFSPDDTINPLQQLVLLTENCPLLEQLHLETSSSVVLNTRTDSSVDEFVSNCPNITSLSLLRFGVDDEIAETLIKGFPQLKHLNLSRTTGLAGYILSCEELNCRCSPLETLILRNCYGLQERKVSLFLRKVLVGYFKSLCYIDVSNGYGVATNGRRRTFAPRYPIEELRKYRPDVTIVAVFQPRPPTQPPSLSSRFNSENTYSGSSVYSSEEEEEEEEEYYDDDE